MNYDPLNTNNYSPYNTVSHSGGLESSATTM